MPHPPERDGDAGPGVSFLIMVLGLAAAVALLTACSSPTIVRDRPTRISVPVIQKCAGERPAPVAPLKQRVPDAQWNALSPKQKAELAAAQAYRRMNHADELGAATSAC